ncbi:ComEC/Rec2 family competence protein [Cellulophaga omnivescoria]|uniref:ComEC/Rec2 family competence protein n=1 Tax=Cellulophaga omnivescoria TaxID=1888890 RepID=UPI0022F119B3|nr:ComEC/Rec2 family competence protein [Cellulophaga omnivescoria]WBU90163.1 ComEC/Rec2 family competence protein [Cellulophaga omnivescoria]
MKPFQFISVKLTLCIITGILIQTALNLPFYISFFALSASLFTLGILFKTSKKRTVTFGAIAAFTVILLGVFITNIANPKNNTLHYNNKNFVNQHLWHLKVNEVLKSNTYDHKYIATLINLDNQNATGNFLLNLPINKNTKELNVDDEIAVFANATPINKPLNPHQFNYALYLKDLGIYHKIEAENNYKLLSNSKKTIRGTAALIKNNIIKKLNNVGFGAEELSIFKALLLGERNTVQTETLDAYKNAGAVHILALSGLHIGILLVVLQFLLSPLEYLPKGKTIKLIIVVLLLWGFAFIAGLSSSLIRAVTMFTFVAYAMFLNRPTSSFNILALSLFFILLCKPNLLFSVGLQMSYSAVFSIVLFNPLLKKMWEPKYYLTNKIWQLLTVSAAAQLGVLPISLYYFHQFPTLFFITNLAIIPFLGIILSIGIVVIILALCSALPNFLVTFYNTIIFSMNSVIKWVATQEAFLIKAISFNKIQMLFSYIFITLLFLFLAKKSFKRTAWMLSIILIYQTCLIYYNHQAFNKEELLILHQNKNTVVIHQSGKELKVHSSDSIINKNTIQNIKIAERINNVTNYKLKNNYNYNNNLLIIVDSLATYPKNKNSIVLLTQSTKLNLNRLITEIKPKQIIADGSNYKSTVALWRSTCLKRKIPFYYTGEKGYYTFN